jgi:fluoride exporter
VRAIGTVSTVTDSPITSSGLYFDGPFGRVIAITSHLVRRVGFDSANMVGRRGMLATVRLAAHRRGNRDGGCLRSVPGPCYRWGCGVQPAASQRPVGVGVDVDLRVGRPRRQLRRAPWAILGVISLGGATGALARYGLAVAWPHRPEQFPWATFVTNVSGCLLIGVLMVLITEVWSAHRLLRPFLGVGVLGGFTTFSTYTVDIQQLVAAGAARTGLVYLAGTLAAALTAVYLGMALTRLVTRTHPRRKEMR